MTLPRTTRLPALLLGAGLAATLVVAYFLHDTIDHFDHDHAGTGMARLSHWPVWLELAGGLVISLLLASQARLLGRRQAEAERLAEAMTVDLRAREQQLRDNQQRLVESERRWKFALEGTDLGVWDRDLVADTVYLSRRWLEIGGYAEGEVGLRHDDWLALLHPEDRPAVVARVKAVDEGREEFFVSEHRLRCRDGHYKWVLDRGMVAARDDAGRPLRAVGTLFDIDARKQREQEREEYLRFFRLSTDLLCITDLAGTLRGVNPALAALLGYADDELSGRSLRDLVHPEDLDLTLAGLRRFTEAGPPFEFENRLVRRDGHLVRLAWRAFHDADHQTLYCSARDISGAHQARLRIEHLDKLYAALSACNAAIVHCESEEELFAEICQILVRFGGVAMAWVGRIDPVARRVLPVYSFGDGSDYLDGLDIGTDPVDPQGRGPTGGAARENRAVWSADEPDTPALAPWRERVARQGWLAAGALPLCYDGQPVAVLSLHARQADFFDDETRRLLGEMAVDVGYALDKFAAAAEVESSRGDLVESEQRFQAIVEQSVAGAFIIQDGALVYVNPRFLEILGYADSLGLLGRPPLDFVAPRDRARIQDNFRRLLAGELHHSESVFTALRADGSGVEVGTNSFVAAYRGRAAVIGMGQDISDRKVAEAQIQRYAGQLERLLVQTVGLATTISEMRDPYTAGHERRVAEIALAIGREMGLDADRLEGLRIGGYLHDVGKIRIPTEILSKPGRLTPTEDSLIQQHPQDGYEVLKDVEFPWPVALVALQHHERWDGGGYPQGLVGEAILLEARIVAVADVIESMASHRPYRPAIGLEAALTEVEEGSGSRYAPQVAAACLRLFREGQYQLPA